MKLTVLKPGLLVSLRTSVRGGIKYQRTDLEQEHATSDGGKRARWETTREIEDAQEFERATVARGKARAAITAACCSSSFGLLCPNSSESNLDAAIAIARGIADTHNSQAALSFVDVYVIVGRIAQDDAEAIRAIGAEVRELLEAMQAGIKAADPEAIRDAANKARSLGAMLTPEVSGRVQAAIKEARLAAREIVKRVEKDGQAAADVVAVCSVKALEQARFAFLDLEGGAVESQAPAPRALELPPEVTAGAARRRACNAAAQPGGVTCPATRNANPCRS